MDLERTALLGVGVSYAFTTAAGERAAIIIRLNRQRDIVIYDPQDRERVLHALVLDAAESRAVAELLDLPVVVDQLTELPRALDGVGAVRMSASCSPTAEPVVRPRHVSRQPGSGRSAAAGRVRVAIVRSDVD